MLTYLNTKCLGNHTHEECEGGDCEAFGDYSPDIVDAIRAGFGLCCGPSSQLLLAIRDSRNGVFGMDHVVSCAGSNLDQVVTSHSRARCASHMLAFPRACDLPLGESVVPHYGSRDIPRDAIGDAFPTTIDAVSEASNENDSGDVVSSLVLEEISSDGRDEYVEFIPTFPRVPQFLSFAAVCAPRKLRASGLTLTPRLPRIASSLPLLRWPPSPASLKKKKEKKRRKWTQRRAYKEDKAKSEGLHLQQRLMQPSKGKRWLEQEVGQRPALGAQRLRAADQPKDRLQARMLSHNL
jgi:hypothetical protein